MGKKKSKYVCIRHRELSQKEEQVNSTFSVLEAQRKGQDLEFKASLLQSKFESNLLLDPASENTKELERCHSGSEYLHSVHSIHIQSLQTPITPTLGNPRCSSSQHLGTSLHACIYAQTNTQAQEEILKQKTNVGIEDMCYHVQQKIVFTPLKKLTFPSRSCSFGQ